ncbi:hypothetical protein BGZ93_009830 [Podila epicladia]|nr:hypothetical protein BGZ92_009855 [Podila epicladia]KAG0089506.1 hypothetical protein BGZ93_009830 [Podila epicladia]
MPRVTRRSSMLEAPLSLDNTPSSASEAHSETHSHATEAILQPEVTLAQDETRTPGRGRGRGPGRPRGSGRGPGRPRGRGNGPGRPRSSLTGRGRGRATVTIVPTATTTDTEPLTTLVAIASDQFPAGIEGDDENEDVPSSDSGSGSGSGSSSNSSDSDSGEDSSDSENHEQDKSHSGTLLSTEDHDMFNSAKHLFMEEDAFNKYSSHGTGRLADRFFDREKSTTVDMDTKMDESIASTLMTLATGETPLQNDNDSIQSGTQKQLTITDLVASVNSYHPDFTSALDQAKPKQQEVATGKQATQKQQVQPLMPLPPAVSYRHPCIFFHEHRSALSKEDHRRFIMYDRIMRSPNKSGKPPSIGPEDHALWIQLQKMVELERSEVRKWDASFVRPRLSSHLHPSFKGAMEPKFKRGRDRVVRDYPQYYDFLSTIGLRLPGMPSGSQKEPVLSRMKPEVQPSSDGTPIKGDVSDALRNRGLLARKGKICQVSIARPIWPTDDNGVPIEKDIEVDDSYWKVSDPEVDEVKSGNGKHKDFRRTGNFPKKNRADPVSLDPLVKQFVEEQRVHIALAASTIVTLAKVLPSLASEWEIPVKVVLEEDSKGEKHKRIYIDKPLIQKRMTAMEMTQMFYDGALKKLALDGQPPKDVGILTSVVTPPTSASAPKENPTPKENTTPKEDGTPMENTIPKENSNPKENDPKETTSEGNTMSSEDPSPEPGVATLEREKTLADKDKDSDGANTANVAGDASATGHGSDDGFLGSSAGENSIDNFEYSLWTFGDLRLLIRDRLHGFLADQTLMRQVVLKAILDYAPEIGPGEPGKSSMAGWWMSTWIRDDRLVALGRVDVSKNQFVRYPSQLSENLDFENPLGAVFSDLPALQVLDASQLRLQDRDVGEWIKPSMRLIHYILGKLMQLGPGQYILGHKRFDVNANIYRAVDVESVENKKTKASSARYDLHAAHQLSPQLLSENSPGNTGGMAESSSSQNTNGVSGTVVDDDLVLRWIGTPDQIPGTFPYQEPTGGPSIVSEGDKGRQSYQKRRRGGGGGGGGSKKKQKKKKKAT